MPGLDMKFFIWARGRWRELSLSTGRVDGAGTKPVRFFYVNKDRLEAARGPRVLRALRSLADAKPTEVHDGPPVPQRKCVRTRARRRSRSRRHRHCCCTLTTRQKHCNTSSREASQNVHIRSTHAPCLTDAGVQVSGDELNTIDKGNGKTADRSVKSPLKAAQTETAQVAPQPRAKRKRSRTPTKQNKKHATTDSDGDQSMLSLQLRRRDRPCKELTIAENDVDLYRTYLLKTDPDFDVYRFDTDDNFKMQLFYKIHPLVSLAHCERLERMLHERRISQADISLKDFATKLGLRSVSDQEGRRDKRYKMRRRTVAQSTPSASDETDKENFIVNRRSEPRGDAERDRTLRKRLMVEAVRRNIDKTGALEKVSATKNVRKGERKKEETILVSSSSGSASEFVQKKPKFFTKKPAPKNNPMKLMSQSSKKSVSSNKSHGGREYSNLEDHAIVSFVSGGDRARLVNGNRVWRELEEQYHRLTGHSRSWHSLRNRYLRHILPSLGLLALSAQHAARLRAAAARGELKHRKRTNSEQNPLYAVPRVHSAWAARPRSPAPAPTPSPTPSPAPSPSPAPATLRARKKEDTEIALEERPPRRSLRSGGPPPPAAAAPSPSSPTPSRAAAPLPLLPQARVRPRMRKLYNPNTATM